MSWTELLNREIESTYRVTSRLLDLVDDDALDWKPRTGSNWMTIGQLLRHLTDACGASIRGFVTGDWGLPEGMDISKLPPEEMLPPAEKMPAIGSVAETRILLEADRQTALAMLKQCSEKRLAKEKAPAPWDDSPMILGHRLLQMVEHLKQHKSQLFYYLKLQGKPVNTLHLWGE
ncbi:MAG: DinB family protein [Calditrichia bacterium]